MESTMFFVTQTISRINIFDVFLESLATLISDLNVAQITLPPFH